MHNRAEGPNRGQGSPALSTHRTDCPTDSEWKSESRRVSEAVSDDADGDADDLGV